MGMKVRGNMFCKRCNTPVAAQKTTTRLRNAVAIGGSVATGGVSLLAGKVNGWHCPQCGGDVVKLAVEPREPIIRRAGESNAKLLGRALVEGFTGRPMAENTAPQIDSDEGKLQYLSMMHKRGILSDADYEAAFDKLANA